MKQNLFFSIKLALIVGVGAAVGASAVIADQKPDTCSYDPVSGNFIENGIEYNFGSWEHARQCARDGRLPEIVLSRLGAFGEEGTRAEAETLKAENRRVAGLRRSQQQSRFSEPSQKVAIPQAITAKEVVMTSTNPDVAEVLSNMGKNANPETVGVKKIIDPDPNRRSAMEFGTDDENSTDWIK